MNNKTHVDNMDWLQAELNDTLDEDYELEMSEPALSLELRKIYKKQHPPTLDRTTYFKSLLTLQAELIKLQDWVVHTDEKIAVVFEGRDAAGKGGVIKRIVQRLNPRVCHVVALNKPTKREKSQWYFQRYVPHMPSGGEIVLFDRSWYNRSGVERVMGFASPEQVEKFFQDVPEFERMLVRSGIRLIKYWFSITDEEQQLRFMMRIHDPLKQWKLSPMDLQSRIRWEDYTKAKEETLTRTNIPEAPWFIIEGNDKKRARLNCIHHLLEQIPYEDVSSEEVTLPERMFNPNYEREVLPPELDVPNRY
ncbi:MAG: polyphosphate kinase 2 [gamma proteobacterium symbiont of Bathyaustriella thionipta]|nr:polyphosphate kinase 2 [gamma proteobacterium symbiont of Bathyaustriella thionipta]MCU7951258.1 polyphosphate kinase 2 [gamma proteobacterium symbiont of Bathyaustriella thionipta]MCU7952401.1 polyphosphate kinase 2 [gamma proteobacterium symbiont of Bathyaustriella thionipta]MCU7957793.1 polyphosphate kinase 2 [gamma proteobacterium symbiont of Bathyaustriella thionipta]MCU7967829.1 polyphosphate kinase 2 [gamma proteobacterium symbiont of Bathyaustriella thionipta]